MKRFRRTMTVICSVLMCVSLCTGFVYAEEEEPVISDTLQDEEEQIIPDSPQEEEESVIPDDLQEEKESDILNDPQDEEITIDETTFPDENFRNFVKDTYDADHSGSLSVEERSQVEYLTCSEQSISNLTGIGYFPNLIYLSCQQNNLTELDLSQNTALEQLYCFENQITNLDLSVCPNLLVLSCANNLFTSLDLSNNPEIKWIYCGDNPQLQSLNVRNCSKTTIIYCYRCVLTQLDVSDCVSLSSLFCFHNNIESLDVSKNTGLRFFYTGYNKLSSLDVSKNPNLRTLGAQANQIGTLDIRNNEQLIALYKTGEKSEHEYEGKKYYYYTNAETRDELGFDADVELIFEEKGKVQEVFADVNEGDWFVSAVQYVYDKNLMAGKGADTFAPNAPLRREEFTQILYNHMGKPEVTIDNPFADVKDGWYKNSVLWAKENGIANGKVKDGKTVFDVGNNITREELALMFYKYARLRDYNLDCTEGASQGFMDSGKVSSWARQAMDWAVSQGIMSGKGATGAPKSEMQLDPQGKASRAECASMITKLLKKN